MALLWWCFGLICRKETSFIVLMLWIGSVEFSSFEVRIRVRFSFSDRVRIEIPDMECVKLCRVPDV